MGEPSRFKVKGLRWYMVAMLCVASELNYLDRQTLSVLAKTIQDDLGLTTQDYARITSAFLMSYTVMYLVSGRLIDSIGTRRAFLIFVTSWSIASSLHAFARTVSQFWVCRFLLGATEPANFPAGVKAVSEWFPMRERALAVGIFNAGTAVGAAVAAPVVSVVALYWGWQSAFLVGGGLGLIWVVVWALVYRVPREHPWLEEKELRLIESGEPPTAAPKVSLKALLRMRETWGCVAARALTDPVSYFFTFWTPMFFQRERGFTLADLGKYSWIPFVALALGNIAGGAVPNVLVRRGWSIDRARKTTMLVASCTVPVCCLMVTRVPSAAMAVGLISLAMFAHSSWGNITLPAEVFPTHVVATVSGLGGCLGGLFGVVSQQGIGWAVQHLSFAPVFAVCACMHLTAFFLVRFLVGELGRVRPVPA